jgi:hypothetical protein
MVVRVIAESSADEMVATFLLGELTSERFGPSIRVELTAAGLSDQLLIAADLADEKANRARRDLLGATRGYGHGRWLFDADFPADVRWVRAILTPGDLAQVRYVDYSYWNELSGGSRLPIDAATRIRQGVRVFGVSNSRFLDAAQALARGERFPPLLLVGVQHGSLVCLEGHLRLTAHALAGYPMEVECLVGTAPTMDRWAR